MTLDTALTDFLSRFPRTDKVWGLEALLVSTPLYTAKLLLISPGFQCSLHYHNEKDETFIVLSGTVDIEVGAIRTYLTPQRPRAHVRPGDRHRFGSRGGAILLEVSTYHDDADVVRIEASGRIP